MNKFKPEREDLDRPFIAVDAFITRTSPTGEKQVLLGKRKKVIGNKMWHIPGGHIRFGETFEQALIREVKEETGLDIKKGKILWIEENFLGGSHHITITFQAELKDPNQKPENKEPEKCYGWKWFDIQNLPAPLWRMREFILEHTSRKRIRRFGDPARDWIGLGVAAVIMDEKNRVLLQKRGAKASNEIGKWKFPGGRVEYGEKVKDALVREIKEELGVQIEIVRFIDNLEQFLPQEQEHWFVPFFLCRIKSGTPKNLEPKKHEQIKWFSLKNLPENMAVGNLQIAEKLIKQLNL